MKTKREFLSNYSVKINVDNSFRGSGILVPVNKDTCYLITAKHNFDIDENKPFSKSLLDNLDYQNIQIYNDENQEICKVSKVVYQKDDKEDDLIIFFIKDTDEFIKNLDPIFVLKDEPNDEVEHFFRGYPNGGIADLMTGLYSRNFDMSKPSVFTFKNQHQIEANHLKGYSGSGVFIKEKAIFYLVGILLESKDGNYYYTCYDLSKVIDEINQVILPNIKTQKNILDIENFEDMQDLIIRRNPYNPLIQEYKSIFQGDRYKDSKLPDKSKEIGYLGKKFQMTNQFAEREANFRKELADIYLLATIISKKFGEETLVKEYFKKAREYEPRYIRYLKDIEIEYSIDELMRDAKIALIEDRFNDAKIFFEALLSLNINDTQRIYSYEKILEIAKVHYNDKKIIKTSKILLKLYPKEEVLKKSIIYYDLSMMDIDESEQVYNVEEGLSLIITEITNSSFFEIKYKLQRRLNELLGVEEELFESQDSSLSLRRILKKLGSVNKNYRSEYQQIVLKEKYQDIIKKTSKRIWFAIIFTLLPIAFLLYIVFNIPKSIYKVNNEIINGNEKAINDFNIEKSDNLKKCHVGCDCYRTT